MRVKIDFRKSVEENAAIYFEKAKKLKKKREGVVKIIEEAREKLSKLEEVKPIIVKPKKKVLPKKWYHKFRWFYTSNGLLCIGGRDATSNEVVIKKHTDSNDIVFHTDMAGSPFFVIKTEGKTLELDTLQEVANATASFSRAWKLGLNMLEVFYVRPEQVTKEAMPGEYLSKGAFMIYGKTNYLSGDIQLFFGKRKESSEIMCGPKIAVYAQCVEPYVKVLPGRFKPSDIAKKIKHKLGGELDEIIRLLPGGNSRIE